MKLRILVTAGPTREKIDPVRFISNYSTGSFGYAIAKEASLRGHKVTLVSGPVSLKAPSGVRFLSVESAEEMRRAVTKHIASADCLIMAAAVSDWRPILTAKSKIKRSSRKNILRLKENTDILKTIGKRTDKILVGFALETENVEQNARKKLKEKKLDLIVANKLTGDKKIFGENKTSVVMIDKSGTKEAFKNKSKEEMAKIILDKVSALNI